MDHTPTPHNSAKKEDIAKTVLMPGDPKRAKWIAETFLESPRLINDIRGIQGYTGAFRGVPVTVMASGIGISSIGIYAYEFYNFYDVDLIIRTGTAGSIREDVKVGDVVIADKAYTNSNFIEHLGFEAGYAPGPDKETLENLVSLSAGVPSHTGAVLTEDLYYSQEDIVDYWKGRQVLAFEMEAACLFALAQNAKKKAGAIFTISNNILTGEEMDPEQRERALDTMVKIALEAGIK